MPHVVALYRYPIKGFTPERLDEVTVQPDGRVAGDRVLAFRFADAQTPEQRDGLDYWPKSRGLSLQDFPSLAVLRLRFDQRALRIRLTGNGDLLVDATLHADGRAELEAAVTSYVLSTPDAYRLGRDGRLPLRLVGDGVRSRFQDRPNGYVSVHSTASVGTLGGALGLPIDDRRFRSNIVIDGVDAGAELDWTGSIRIGEVAFTAAGPILRCLATHANPDTGVRDAPVLTTLTGALGLAEPALGTLLLLNGVSGSVDDHSGSSGVIRVGDEVIIG